MNSVEKLNLHSADPCQRLTIMIIASSDYIEPLKDNLQIDSRQSYGNKLMYYICEHIEDVLAWTKQNSKWPDYIAIVLDPRNKNSLEMVEQNIQRLDQTYIQGGRVCLVNGGSSLGQTDVGISLGYCNLLAQKYSLVLINGDAQVPDKCLLLAKRINKLASRVCGLFTGVPVSVDVPGYSHFCNK